MHQDWTNQSPDAVSRSRREAEERRIEYVNVEKTNFHNLAGSGYHVQADEKDTTPNNQL